MNNNKYTFEQGSQLKMVEITYKQFNISSKCVKMSVNYDFQWKK